MKIKIPEYLELDSKNYLYSVVTTVEGETLKIDEKATIQTIHVEKIKVSRNLPNSIDSNWDILEYEIHRPDYTTSSTLEFSTYKDGAGRRYIESGKVGLEIAYASYINGTLSSVNHFTHEFTYNSFITTMIYATSIYGNNDKPLWISSVVPGTSPATIGDPNADTALNGGYFNAVYSNNVIIYKQYTTDDKNLPLQIATVEQGQTTIKTTQIEGSTIKLIPNNSSAATINTKLYALGSNFYIDVQPNNTSTLLVRSNEVVLHDGITNAPECVISFPDNSNGTTKIASVTNGTLNSSIELSMQGQIYTEGNLLSAGSSDSTVGYYSLGRSSRYWNSAYINNLYVSGSLSLSSQFNNSGDILPPVGFCGEGIYEIKAKVAIVWNNMKVLLPSQFASIFEHENGNFYKFKSYDDRNNYLNTVSSWYDSPPFSRLNVESEYTQKNYVEDTDLSLNQIARSLHLVANYTSLKLKKNEGVYVIRLLSLITLTNENEYPIYSINDQNNPYYAPLFTGSNGILAIYNTSQSSTIIRQRYRCLIMRIR